jgi:hypothetical protein
MRSTTAGAVAISAVAVVVTASAVAGCSSSPGRAVPTAADSPQVTQAIAAATKEFGLLAGGGWAPAWGLWSDSARQVISQDDFVRLNTECRPVLGVPTVVGTTTVVDPDTVRVAWRHAGTSGSNVLIYEAGTWHFVPDDGALAEFRLGVDHLVRDRRAKGLCR